MTNLKQNFKKLKRILKREKLHLHHSKSWRYDKNMNKVFTNEDEF